MRDERTPKDVCGEATKTYQLILIRTKINICVNVWTEFPLNNRQKL